MYIAYLDDSRDATICVCSAMLVAEESWLQAFQEIKAFRLGLKQTEGLFTRKEWHATDFVAGRGRIADRTITKGRRAQIFGDTLRLMAGWQGVGLINAVMPRKHEVRAYERLLNRINRTMREWNSRAILIWDAGKDAEYRRLARRMSVYNPIPSKFGQWETGEVAKNIPTVHIVEDPIFKDSRESYFLQIVDFCAYALLRRESPLPAKSRYGLDTAFNVLGPLLVLEANADDPEGIIRP